MATWDDVRRIALGLPEVVEVGSRGVPSWRVRQKHFVWERPLRKADLAELGERAPRGSVLGAYVPDEGVKEALIAEDPTVYFTTTHFDGYPVVLVRIDEIGATELTELVTEAWLVRAPKRVAAAYLEASGS